VSSGGPVEATVARAGREDAAEILALQKLAYQTEAQICGDFTIPPLVQTLPEMQADTEQQLVLKASVEGRIIGSVRAHQREGTCFIGRVIVDPAYQGRGLGQRLMSEIEQRFATADRFELFTGEKSERNLHFYRKLGYQVLRIEQLSPKLRLVFLEKPVVRP
jgi:ribosomal protein S18 acetylase RimI-like enzyme